MKSAAIALTFVWVGLLIGLVFIETPLKFHADGITPALALGIGKLVFAALNAIEWGLLICLTAALFRLKLPKTPAALLTLLLIIVAAQTFYLLPILNDRVAQYQQGITPPASTTHTIYMIIDGIKLIALITLGVMFARTKPIT
jgi:hypothetical protein